MQVQGWGLVAEQKIPKGQVICEYAGESIKSSEADERLRLYDEGKVGHALLVRFCMLACIFGGCLLEMKYSTVNWMMLCCIQRARPATQLTITVLDTATVIQVVRQHMPSGSLVMRFNIDATKRGNAARFINHRCGDPNTTLVIVWQAGVLLPVVAVVARADIQQGEELTFSYGDEVGSVDTLAEAGGSLNEVEGQSCITQPCFCDSSFCKGFMPVRVPR
jgi:[histone H3]-lysine36 N-dimethyltransferase SETMAR